MRNKFPVLHVIVWIFRVLGVLVLVVALIAGIAGLAGGFTRGFGMMDRYQFAPMMGYFGGFIPLISGLLSGIFLYGFGEVIAVLLSIEENTRVNRRIVEEKPQTPAEPPVIAG